MSRVIIHIGTPKTATSTIQSFLHTNAKALQRQGYVYPHMWGRQHFPLSILSFEEDRWEEPCAVQAGRLGFRSRRPTLQEWRGVRRETKRQFMEALREAPGKTFIFSNEGLYARLRRDDTTRLRILFEEAGIDARVIAYLRSPLAMRVSQVGQYIKMGWHLDLGASFDPLIAPVKMPEPKWDGARIPNRVPQEMYFERLKDWDHLFPHRLSVQLFKSEHSPGEGIIHDFCQWTGIRLTDDLVIPNPVNRSLPWNSILLLNEVNRRVNRRLLHSDGSLNLRRILPPQDVDLLADTGPKLSPSPEMVASFEAKLESTNEALRQRYFSHLVRLWPPDNPKTDSSPEVMSRTHMSADQQTVADLLSELADSGAPNQASDRCLTKPQLRFIGHARRIFRIGRTSRHPSRKQRRP